MNLEGRLKGTATGNGEGWWQKFPWYRPLKVVKKTKIDQVKMAQKQKQGHYLSERCDDNGV
jgi:hypothetical protein